MVSRLSAARSELWSIKPFLVSWSSPQIKFYPLGDASRPAQVESYRLLKLYSLTDDYKAPLTDCSSRLANVTCLFDLYTFGTACMRWPRGIFDLCVSELWFYWWVKHCSWAQCFVASSSLACLVQAMFGMLKIGSLSVLVCKVMQNGTIGMLMALVPEKFE